MPRTAKSRPRRQSSAADLLIPDKLYFRIGEVSKITDTKSYVLRYWETEFPSLKPVRRSGHRLYRRKDVETVLKIKRLLYEQGFTIEGARKQLGDSPDEVGPLFRRNSAMQLRAIKLELERILTMLSRKC
jgi:DNA-binding transcriptional MerR regulator